MHKPTARVWILLFCMLSVINLSCKKFLATYSQNESFIESAADLNEILIGDAYLDDMVAVPDMLYAMDDDTQLGTFASSYNFAMENGFHYWQAQPRINSLGQLFTSDPFFTLLYNRISRINTILHNVPLLRGKGESSKSLDRISGEAHFLRAWYYFMLVNIYGKPYKSSSASDDFGVPLITDPAIKDQFVSRSTTKQVYDQILSDLLDAERELVDANQSSTLRANQASAQALLSRVYLFMENYAQALRYADLLINSGSYHLKNLNGHVQGEDFLDKDATEVIFTMGRSAMSNIMLLHTDIPSNPHYLPSDDLVQSYSPQDLRLQVFFLGNSKGQLRVAKKRKVVASSIDDVSDMFLLRLSEVYLNKSEALAGLGRFQDARASILELWKNRYKATELPQLTAEGATLMNIIRDERRLELCLESHRWFDLRRYAVNTIYPFSKPIRHRSVVFTGSGFEVNGYYELGTYEQDAAAYIVPIANEEIDFNRGLLFNEPRPVRLLKQ